MFSAKDVKDLREKTGAGMLDCKKALEASEGNMDKAIDWLREKGISKAAKKESRIAAEGITVAASNDDEAILFEVNCETDFVTKNEKFNALIKELRDTLMFADCKTEEEANQTKLSDGKTVAERIVEAISTIGEKISFRRFQRVTKKKDETFGIYSHMGGRITSFVVIQGIKDRDTAREVAKDVAMHVAAMRPLYLTRDEVPEEVLNHEKEIIKEQAINEGKPADIAEKMVNGRINKYYKEVCLLEQEFIKDSDKSVEQYVKEYKGTIKKMIRYEVGEGIEKRNDDFAEEVMKQING